MLHLDDLRLFTHVARAGSFSEAARQLALTPAAVSAAVKRIEAVMRQRLVERSTRTARLTPEGERFGLHCEQMLAQWAKATEPTGSSDDALQGEVHLTAPADTTYQLLSPWLAHWRGTRPGLRLRLQVSDRLQDVRREAVDIAVRYGVLEDSNLVARRLCSGPRVLVASPGYVRRHGAPQAPADLLSHEAVLWHRSGRPFREWRFWRGKTLRGTGQLVQVNGGLCGDGALVREWALQGRGICLKALCDVVTDLQAGRLVQLMPGWRSDDTPVHAVLPSRDYQPLRVRLVLDALVNRFASLQAQMDAWQDAA